MARQSRDILTVVTECLGVVAKMQRQVTKLNDADRSKLKELTWELRQLTAILNLPQDKRDSNSQRRDLNKL